jgi:methylenetetrahydrofolate dehydrogenase (NADP+)/methenyltetrahydrofolate cyclohydrolase
MAAKILDGKKIAANIRTALKRDIAAMEQKPGLAAVLVGDNPASRVYVGIKRRTCEEVGIYSELYELPEKTTEKELLQLIRKLNSNDRIHAILVQLPLPGHISAERVFSEVALEKDVDGFNSVNIGRLVSGNESFVPCTPKGIIRLLEQAGIEIKGKNAVVVGRSSIVGKPTALMLLNRNATVTICHSKTKNLEEITRRADILVVAVGRPKLITPDMVKEGGVVIDVGINRIGGKLVGDVDFGSVKEKAGWITPVPGGVGPMTVAMLLENTVEAAKRRR